MAEIRKHKPSTSTIAQALSAAMGEPIRPVAPGARPFDEDDDSASGPAARGSASGGRTASSAPVDPSQVGRSTSWRGFTVSSLPPRKGPAVHEDNDPDDDV